MDLHKVGKQILGSYIGIESSLDSAFCTFTLFVCKSSSTIFSSQSLASVLISLALRNWTSQIAISPVLSVQIVSGGH